MGAVWAHTLFWLLLGPEMTQEEREEQRVEAQEYEREIMNGRKLDRGELRRRWAVRGLLRKARERAQWSILRIRRKGMFGARPDSGPEITGVPSGCGNAIYSLTP